MVISRMGDRQQSSMLGLPTLILHPLPAPTTHLRWGLCSLLSARKSPAMTDGPAGGPHRWHPLAVFATSSHQRPYTEVVPQRVNFLLWWGF